MAKTSSMLSFGRAVGRHVYVLIGSIREPSDFGIPFPVSGKSGEIQHFCTAAPHWAAATQKGKWIIVLDELLCCPPAVQAGMLRLVAERYVGDLKLPDDVWLCALSNPSSTATNGFDLEPALANRMVHLQWQMDWKAWDQGVSSSEFPSPSFPVMPKDWRKHRGQIGALVSAFRHHMPDLFSPRVDDNGEAMCDRSELATAWPSPRTWDKGVDCLAGAAAVDAPREVRDQLLRGCVGHSANAFLEWEDQLDLPDPSILIDRVVAARADGVDIPYTHPRRVDKVLAMLYSLAHEVCGDTSDANRYCAPRWEAAMCLFAAAADHGAADVMLASVNKMLRGAGGKAMMPKGAKVPEEFKKYYPMIAECLS